ncbi:hypothetical protein [Sulfurimonas sp.]
MFLSIFGISIVGGINYIMDPLWTFSHKYNFNNIQKGFDERQQKTNYVNFKSMNQYKGILLGSSRTTHINQNDFGNMKIFNYASSSMRPYEYKGYIDFFKKKKQGELNYVIIGADFYGICNPIDVKFKKPEFYIDKAQSFMYRYKMLFSIGAIKNSLRNYKIFYTGAHQYYDRDNIKYAEKVSEKERFERYTKNLKRHTESFMSPKYEYNSNLISIYTSLKKNNPNTKIILFTSPITADLLVSIIKNGDKLEEYKQWLKNMVDIFGEVYQFMDINSITTNLDNYPDDDHFYDNVAQMVANKIAGIENKNIPNDFGILLNSSNIDKYLINFENKLKEYKNPLELKK